MEQEFYTENVSACAPPVREKLEPNLLAKKIIFSRGVKDTAPYIRVGIAPDSLQHSF